MCVYPRQFTKGIGKIERHLILSYSWVDQMPMILQDKQLSSKISEPDSIFDPVLAYLTIKASYIVNVTLLKEKITLSDRQ